jgi:hypothetical protein
MSSSGPGRMKIRGFENASACQAPLFSRSKPIFFAICETTSFRSVLASFEREFSFIWRRAVYIVHDGITQFSSRRSSREQSRPKA